MLKRLRSSLFFKIYLTLLACLAAVAIMSRGRPCTGTTPVDTATRPRGPGR